MQIEKSFVCKIGAIRIFITFTTYKVYIAINLYSNLTYEIIPSTLWSPYVIQILYLCRRERRETVLREF